MLRIKNFLQIVIFTSLLFSCASPQEKITEFLEEGDYYGALKYLNENNAAGQKVVMLEPKFIQARKMYQERIEQTYMAKATKERNKGNIRAVKAVLDDGINLCIWSSKLKYEQELVSATISRIDLLYKQHETLGDDILTIFEDFSEYYNLLNDSPKINFYLESLEPEYIKYLNEKLKPESYQDIDNWAGTLVKFPTSLRYLNRELLVLFEAIAFINKPLILLNSKKDFKSLNTQLRNIQSFKQYLSKKNQSRLKVIIATSEKEYSKFFSERLPVILDSDDVSFLLINFSEQHLSDHSIITKPLIKAHLNRANKLIGKGLASFISAGHSARALELSKSDIEKNESKELLNLSLGGLRNTQYPEIKVYIEFDHATNVENRNQLWYNLHRIFWSTNAGKRLFKKEVDSINADIHLVVKDYKEIIPDLSDLSPVPSSYYSHTETIPNPAKATLKFQLELSKISLDSAENSYSNAVNSYNYNPTNYNLQSVNLQKTFYSNALNSYNNLVGQYNRTSSHIKRPVYLPYNFNQGTIKNGWSINLLTKVKEETFSFKKEMIYSDFVRIGSKATDKDLSNRILDGVSADMSFEKRFLSLLELSNKYKQKLKEYLDNFKYKQYENLSVIESEIIALFINPWAKDQDFKDLLDSEWFMQAVSSVEIDDKGNDFKQIELTRSDYALKSKEDIIAYYENVVCGVYSLSNGQRLSRGTGTIISSDGYVLTCAHTFVGPETEVELFKGASKGVYKAEIVSVNDLYDIAILKIKDFSTDKWANIDFDPMNKKGDQVYCISNPELYSKGTSQLAYSGGVISNPGHVFNNIKYLNIDINISSGSSGGPIINEEGEIVGIVEAVIKEGLRSSTSSSGNNCLALPSSDFTSYINLKGKK
ncbi:hypothetical protein LNTAR_15107 [Lentisphaera araneosa HTCC2155]|uniref:Uncharacterized protein n=1 Tax=Lentisphaera araneosa HTCC2155 TaxID=313628 RepID=A6DRE6_9BACT|nr:serine protease [Lentisphaera araneosa]EDM25756.1 hypothetical protein LNTAR_15107 [Lentisphaera araneosa HTCC2155]